MGILNSKILYQDLDAALIFFDALDFKNDVKNVILEQIAGAIIMLESALTLNNDEICAKQLETVRGVVQNLQLFKIAETGSDFSGTVYCVAR